MLVLAKLELVQLKDYLKLKLKLTSLNLSLNKLLKLKAKVLVNQSAKVFLVLIEVLTS